MEKSTVWYRMPSKDVGINYEEIACLPDALYKDDANVKYKKINYRKDLEEGDKEEDNENQKIEVEGSYLYQDKNVNFTDIWWIKKAEGNLVKCESWRTFDSSQESHAVISIRMGEDCEKIQDFPESYLETTKEDLENGEFWTMKLTILGTGNAAVSECYNTCFVLSDKEEHFLVDAGGGNRILKLLKDAGIELEDIHDIFVTHEHIDHVLGVIWLIRMIGQRMNQADMKGT